ncbi:fumarylacetoacetate hydrolase family protein [Microcella sp.]|uniref:fumarylacetoacetate hydrolase family protein n=1 Tax=Microcella sp. TaxID=1913979 RepID=UPI00256354B3|nr:fumarylacetoacetate hydrolase family protein [Microcella sp.]MBX9471923.1 fumarylacetoacetate hydrolase family protein [Microcella sp.]
MQLARVRTDAGIIAVARIADGNLVALADTVAADQNDLVSILNTVPRAQLDERVRQAEAAGDVVAHEDDAHFELPVQDPQKLIGISLNYAAHAAEGNLEVPTEPVVFFLPPSSLVPHNHPVALPPQSKRVDYEVELAIVIGRSARNVTAEQWRDYVAGFTIVNDITARDLQIEAMDRNHPWDLTKAFDTFSPCGPYLATADAIDDPSNLSLSLSIGDRVLQDSSTKHMVFGVGRLIELLSSVMTLEPGDIIATGTPSGIGPVEHGETMAAAVQGIGVLRNQALRAS